MGLVNFLIKIGLDTTDVNIGAKRVETAMKGMADHVLGDVTSALKGKLAAAFGFQNVADQAKQAIERVGRLKDLAETLGTNVENAQRLEHAMAGIGMAADAAAQPMDHLNRLRAEAVAGNEIAIGTFRRLGVSLADVRNPSIETITLMRRIGEALRDGNPDFETRVALMDALGKSGAKLVPALKELADAPPILLVTSEEAERVDRLAKRYEDLKRTFLSWLAIRLSVSAERIGSDSFFAASGKTRGMGNLHAYERTAEEEADGRKRAAENVRLNAASALQIKQVASILDADWEAMDPSAKQQKLEGLQRALRGSIRASKDPLGRQQLIGSEMMVDRDLSALRGATFDRPSPAGSSMGTQELNTLVDEVKGLRGDVRTILYQ